MHRVDSSSLFSASSNNNQMDGMQSFSKTRGIVTQSSVNPSLMSLRRPNENIQRLKLHQEKLFGPGGISNFNINSYNLTGDGFDGLQNDMNHNYGKITYNNNLQDCDTMSTTSTSVNSNVIVNSIPMNIPCSLPQARIVTATQLKKIQNRHFVLDNLAADELCACIYQKLAEYAAVNKFSRKFEFTVPVFTIKHTSYNHKTVIELIRRKLMNAGYRVERRTPNSSTLIIRW